MFSEKRILSREEKNNLPGEVLETLDAHGQGYLFLDKNDEWKTVNKPLNYGLVLGHFQGKHAVGYKITPQTMNLVVDIDLHDYQQSPIIDHILQKRYEFVVNALDYPSFVVRSSRSLGLHLYYRLSNPYYHKGIKRVALNLMGISERELKKAKIEFCLSPTHGLSLPFAKYRGGFFLNPKTLEVLYGINDPYEAMSHIVHAKVSQTFDFSVREKYDDLRPERVPAKVQQNNIKKQGLFFDRLKKIEAEQGDTDSFIYKVSRQGFFCRMGVDEVSKTIHSKLIENGITIHSDTTEKALLSRVRSHYKRFEKTGVEVLNFGVKRPQLDFIALSLINGVAEYVNRHYSLSKRRYRPFITFLEHLYQWHGYIASLTHFEAMEADWHYRFFYFYTKEQGYTPLPKNLLKRWNARYFEWIPILQEIGVLTLKRASYNPFYAKMSGLHVKGICNYYSVDFPTVEELSQKENISCKTHEVRPHKDTNIKVDPVEMVGSVGSRG